MKGRPAVDGFFHGRTGKSRLTRSDKPELSPLRLDAPIVYRLGRVVLIHQSGVRLSVGAPIYQWKHGTPYSPHTKAALLRAAFC
jgi:hypothetical protein